MGEVCVQQCTRKRTDDDDDDRNAKTNTDTIKSPRSKKKLKCNYLHYLPSLTIATATLITKFIIQFSVSKLKRFKRQYILNIFTKLPQRRGL